MVPDYECIGGYTIQPDLLQYEISKRVFKALEVANRLIKLIEVRQNNENDILIIEFELDVPSKPKNDIKGKELIGIVVSADNKLPIVYALREDFPLNLTHTNISNVLRPVDLCIYEETFEELKLSWSGIRFLNDIKSWLELTSIDKLHQDDQPLEPFYISDGIIIYNEETLKEADLVVQLADNVYKLYSDNSLKKDKYVSEAKQHLVCPINSDSIKHGFVNIAPDNISSLEKELKILKIDLGNEIKSLTDKVMLSPNAQKLIRLNPILIIGVNLKRNEQSEAETYIYCFKVNDSLLNINLYADYLSKSPVDNSYTKANLFQSDLSLSNCKNVEVEMLNPQHDFSYLFAKRLNNNLKEDELSFSLIGVGALGSQLLNNFVRQGYGKWNIIDHDIILPHNLTRHQSNRSGIGKHKVWFMSEYINNVLFPNEKIVIPYIENILKTPDEVAEPLSKSDYIIDISTSIAVERLLANEYSDKRKFAAFLNPNGSDLVLLSEDNELSKSLDLIEFQYYKELLNNDKLKGHFELEKEDKVRYARGCRDITSKISQSNLSIFSGILTKAIQNNIEQSTGGIEIWQLSNELSINKLNFQLDEWHEHKAGMWTILVNQKLLEKIFEFRNKKLPNETGGILLGGIDAHYKKIYIVDTIFSPKDSIEERTIFIRGIENVTENLEEVSRRTNKAIEYLGEWHSHPNSCSLSMSNDDMMLFGELLDEAQHRGKPSLMIIFGDNEFNLYIGNHEF